MQYTIAIAAVCPMRADASHKSEMVSQLLLGEVGEVLDAKGDFTKIRCLYDSYEGWCANSQLATIEDAGIVKPSSFATKRNTNALLNGANIPLSLASPIFKKVIAGNYTIEFEEDTFINPRDIDNKAALIKQLAYTYLNVPYLWGGK